MRRMGLESSQVRVQLIEAAAKILSEEGCAAVTARRLAEKVGLKRQSIHYYFSTIEDLLIAVIRREGDMAHDRLDRAIANGEPLRAIWEIGRNANTAMFELSAFALRRKHIQAELRRQMADFRRCETLALSRHLEQRGIKSATPPVASATIVKGLAHALAEERSLGVTEGHEETSVIIEEWLHAFAERGSLVSAVQRCSTCSPTD